MIKMKEKPLNEWQQRGTVSVTATVTALKVVVYFEGGCGERGRWSRKEHGKVSRGLQLV
jgi:hypothetical protein